MSLSEYRRKRDFQRTAEPRGAAPRHRHRGEGALAFVVQKHAARRLHYDLRLEWQGVLLSWAVPKGPSLDPREKRLAVRVEDHPLEYGGFEGAIPQGEYGGGAVLLWDHGVWTPWEDVAESLRLGRLKFTLHGQKLRGGWMLVRKGGAKAPPGEKTWFLIKERDAEARPAAEYDVLEAQPQSVLSQRDLAQIADDPGKLWTQGGARTAPAGSAARPAPPAGRQGTPPGPRKALPEFIEPQLATLVSTPPAGDQWLHEIKFDGYRMLCQIVHSAARFTSRNQQDWTDKLAPLATAAATLPVRAALLDGEVVALAADGRSSFQDLQNAFREGRAGGLVYFAFDLLHLDGHDLTGLPLEERKAWLARIVPADARRPIRLSEFVVGDGPEFFAGACRLQLEGIVSKRRDRPYHPGRGGDWLKAKCLNREEFVIGGFTPPAGARRHFGALLLGYYEGKKLRYAGRVGTGFSDRALADLHGLLAARERATCPFAEAAAIEVPRGTRWVRPDLVAQVEFGGWTRDNVLRHPAFQGLREDKSARDVVRERPQTADAEEMPQRRSSPANTTPKALDPADEPSTSLQGRLAELGVRFTSPEKVLYPEAGITKLELAGYYLAVADWILPHVANRPLAIVRCPDGRHQACFFQKHPGTAVPEALRRIEIPEKGRTEKHLVADDPAGLVGLVQIGALEIHVWQARADKLERPDQLVFDLDPDVAVPWRDVVSAAQELRGFLADLGLTSFLKTTGGKGLHLVVPIARRSTWEQAKGFAQAVALSMVKARPARYVATAAKAQRTGRIFIDYLRNGRGATAIAPYSTRARPGATVSVPLAWDELTLEVRSDRWTIRTLPARLARLKADPWKDFEAARIALSTRVLRQLGA